MDDHSRTIIHVDIDCFYAQVEMLKDPSLREKPVGIQQKNFVITSNYLARDTGIKKCMLITDAKKLCPSLVLVNGEDLYDYRQMSYKVTSILQTYSETVERLGLDENYLDVTNLVKERFKSSQDSSSVGYKYSEAGILCDCGCVERIKIGSQIAQEIRHRIYGELQITVCAGIAHNKLLAKIVGSTNKPNKQTFIFPNDASELILSLELVKNIPWIGVVSAEQLSTINITKVSELQNCSIGDLENIFGREKAETLKNFSFGIDNAPVKNTGKPKSIGLEDSCKALSSNEEVEGKLKWLLRRLMILINEDERIPKTMKLTIRKCDNIHPQTYTRETKQCTINTSIENEDKIMKIIMTLFTKLVGCKKKFQVTLVGLSFTNFVEKTHINNTLTNFITHDPEFLPGKDNKMILKNNSPSTSFCTEKVQECQPKHDSLSINEENLALKDDCIQKEGKILCPPDVNEDVFKELPRNIQNELWVDYKRKREIDGTEKSHKKLKPCSILKYIVKGQKKM